MHQRKDFKKLRQVSKHKPCLFTKTSPLTSLGLAAVPVQWCWTAALSWPCKGGISICSPDKDSYEWPHTGFSFNWWNFLWRGRNNKIRQEGPVQLKLIKSKWKSESVSQSCPSDPPPQNQINKIVWKNLNEHFGQPNRIKGGRKSNSC